MSSEKNALRDKVVLVTGASAGIGRGAAIAFAECGARVALVGRGETELQRTRTLCQQKAPTQAAGKEVAVVVVADLTKPEQCKTAVEECVKKLGRLDCVINNAGIFQPVTLAGLTPKVYDELLSINQHATVFVTQAAAPHLAKTRGCVLNVSSISGLKPYAGALANTLAKAAVNSFTQYAALELAPQGIRVNAICPTVTEGTLAFEKLGMDDEATHKWLRSSARVHPLGHNAQISDLVNSMLYLCDPEKARCVTGVLLPVDCGRTLALPEMSDSEEPAHIGSPS